MAPIEVLAAIQYLSSCSLGRATGSSRTRDGRAAPCTGVGYLVAVDPDGLVRDHQPDRHPLAGARRTTRSRTWKVVIPVLTIIVLLVTHFHGVQLHQAAAASSSTARPDQEHPDRDPDRRHRVRPARLRAGGAAGRRGDAIPSGTCARAVILSILIGAAIYILLQVAFIGALDPQRPGLRRTAGRTSARPAPTRRWSTLQQSARSTRWPRSPASPGWPSCCGIDARDLAERHRAHLPDLLLAPELRAEQERLRPDGVRDD